MNLTDAIYKLYPQVKSTIGDSAYDANGNKVTYDLQAVQAYVNSKSYIAQRQAEYPAITEQLDTIFHQGLDAWKEQIQAVKDKYPKGIA